MEQIISYKGLIFLAGLFLSYLLGSLPPAYVLVRVIKKQDIRQLGSGNVGATNASRILGKRWGIFVLGIDILKALIPVIVIADYILGKVNFFSEDALRLILGFSAVSGHSWPLFLRFKGGKAVASTFGVMLGLALKINGFFWILISLVIIWIIVFLFSRIVSLASVFTAFFLPFLMVVFKQSKETVLMSLLFSFLIISKHIPNIQRVIQKKEPRL
ncbi:MAG: glycerol-3-phosphate 1-O-acyltransferase PlsY [Candidatus Omnitrophica bacterium]|nr:glycerol-3-phosphate 1-O-acyltransferase PlsY [Candidatus Omnitrophota bacterium]